MNHHYASRKAILNTLLSILTMVSVSAPGVAQAGAIKRNFRLNTLHVNVTVQNEQLMPRVNSFIKYVLFNHGCTDTVVNSSVTPERKTLGIINYKEIEISTTCPDDKVGDFTIENTYTNKKSEITLTLNVFGPTTGKTPFKMLLPLEAPAHEGLTCY